MVDKRAPFHSGVLKPPPMEGNKVVAMEDICPPEEGVDVEALAEALHVEHAREFPWMQGTDLSDPVLASECGNCQRWARYAMPIVAEARRATTEQITQALMRDDIRRLMGQEYLWDMMDYHGQDLTRHAQAMAAALRGALTKLASEVTE